MKATSSTLTQQESFPGDRHTDSQTDSEDTDSGEMDINLLTNQFGNPHTRQLLKQERKEKKKTRNKKIRKRIRRVLRTSWKWFRRGCAQLGPAVHGIGMAFGPVIKPYSTGTNSSSVYGARP